MRQATMARLCGLAVVALTVGAATTPAMGQAGAVPSSLVSDRPGGTRAADGEWLLEATIPQLQAAMEAGWLTSRALVEVYLERIRAYDRSGPELNALLYLNPAALERADAMDRERLERGPRGPLHGIPIVLKDNFNTADMPTTGGSVALAGFVPPRDAFQVRKLREAGAVVIGKTNLHELARGITTVSSLGGQTRNPYDPTRNPGGSSGGTAVAVASSFAAVGMGTDTCGSIRIPAAQNNLFGLRPTVGLSSRAGIIPLSHSQDVAGPIARSVVDLAIILDATVAVDPEDPTTVNTTRDPIPDSYAEALDPAALEGARIGIIRALFGTEPADAEVAAVIDSSLQRMARQGAEVIDVEITGIEGLGDVYSTIRGEFRFDLARYLEESGAPVRSLAEILESGSYHPELERSFRSSAAVESLDTADYREALARREEAREAIVRLMDANDLDALAYPTIRQAAAPIGERQRGSNCTFAVAAVLPAISVPAGFTPGGLPVGLELAGRQFAESRLLQLAYAFEQADPPRRMPPHTPPLRTTAVDDCALCAVAGGRQPGRGDGKDEAGPAPVGGVRKTTSTPEAESPDNGTGARETARRAPPQGRRLSLETESGLRLGVFGQLRIREEHKGNQYSPGNPLGATSRELALLRTRLGFDIEVDEHVGGVIELQDSRVLGEEGSTAADTGGVDLKRGFFRFGNLFGEPFSVDVGRFVLGYGDERLIGALDWSNIGRSYDGFRASYAPDGYFVDLFGYRIRDNPGSDEDNDVLGVYASTELLLDNVDVDAYALWIRDGLERAGELGIGDTGYVTFGTRVGGRRDAIDYSGEIAFQRGDLNGDDLRAWAFALVAGYTFDVDSQPRIGIEFDRATGNREPADGVSEQFQTLFPTNHIYYGHADIAAWTNIRAFKLASSFSPRPDLRVSLDFHHLQLDDADGDWVGASGAAIRPGLAGAGRELANEIDMSAAWTCSPGLGVLGGWAHVFPGAFIEATGAAPDADFGYLQLLLSF